MKDNFTNPKYHKYLKNQGSGYSEHLKNYTDLAKQPTADDAFADVFLEQAKGMSSEGAMNQAAKGVLGSIGGAIKGKENQRRKDELEPYLRQAASITAKAAELEAQVQEDEANKAAIANFGQRKTTTVAEMNDALKGKDWSRVDNIFRGLVGDAAQTIPGYENLEGESWNAAGGYGLALNKETGEYRKITADEIMSAIAPAAQAVYGDQWFHKFTYLNAGVAQDAQRNYERGGQIQQLELQGKVLQNQKLQSEIGYNTAHTEAEQYKMSNSETQADTGNQEEISNILSAAEEAIIQHGTEGQRNAFNRFYKAIAPDAYSPNASEVSLDSAGDIVRGKFFKSFGFRNETEFNHIPTISANNSPDANRAIIQQYRNFYLKYGNAAKGSITNIQQQSNTSLPNATQQNTIEKQDKWFD